MNYLYLIIPVVIFLLLGIRIVRPTHRGLLSGLENIKNLQIPDFTGLFRLLIAFLW